MKFCGIVKPSKIEVEGQIMNDILYRAAAYLLIIALGVFLKKVGFFMNRFSYTCKNFAEYHVALCNYLFIFKSRFSDFAFNSDSTKSFCWNSYDVYCIFYIENDRKKREYSV